MGLFDKYGRRRNERQRAKKEFQMKLCFGVGIVAFLVLMVFLGKIGPRSVGEYDELPEEITDTEVQELRDEVSRLLEQFNAVRESGDLSPDDIAILKVALDKQKILAGGDEDRRPVNQDLQRLVEIENLYQTIEGSFLHEISRDWENKAEIARGEGRREDAVHAYGRAIEAQVQIHRSYARGDYYDLTRLSRLKLLRDELNAEPVARDAENNEQDGKLAFNQGNYVEALKYFAEARQLYLKIDRQFGSTRFARMEDMHRIENRITDARAGMMSLRITELKDLAEEKAENGRVNDAVVDLNEAISIQENLMAKYPNSRFADTSELQALEVLRQTVQSKPLAEKVSELHDNLNLALRDRRVIDAIKFSADLYRAARDLHESYKNSADLDSALLAKARFLNLIRDNIGPIQDAVHDGLLPVPGYEGVRMFRTETTQVLFRLVMGDNPSSKEGTRLPVDSIGWETATEFCQRLSWIMGNEVRLPLREEVLAALGEVRRSEVTGISWNSQNSEGNVKPVGQSSSDANGFFDLLGNVAEWCGDLNPEDEREALLIGGSVRDSPISLVRIPQYYSNLKDRNRYTGFRFVMVTE